MTKIEMEYMGAVKEIARELRRSNTERTEKGPDWEQRRYEIARELFPVLTQIKHNGTGIKSLSDVRELAIAAVDGANVLIDELRAPYNKRDYGKGE